MNVAELNEAMAKFLEENGIDKSIRLLISHISSIAVAAGVSIEAEAKNGCKIRVSLPDCDDEEREE